jgi:hypothetical protein
MIKLSINLDNGHLKIRLPLYHSGQNYLVNVLSLAKHSLFYNLLNQTAKRFCQSLYNIQNYLPMHTIDQNIE